MTESAAPRLATMDDDGWTLLDAEERLARGDDIYWLPDRWIRDHLDEHVPERGYVKLLFRIFDPAMPDEPMIERMWVTLDARDGELYHGHLANEPQTQGTAREGMAVWYRAEHVIDYAGPNGENQASASAEAVRCGRHGVSERCYVCEHLTPDSEGRGFHCVPDDATLRPDAWCDACQRVFEAAGDWERAGGQEPKIHLVCGGCYDALRDRHRRNAPPGDARA